jgi:acetyl-CoA acetyltransferase
MMLQGGLLMANLSKSVAIVGVDESDEIGRIENKSSLQHHAEAGYNALADAGFSVKDVDGLFTAGFSTLTTGEYMGIKPRYTDSTAVGGSSFVIHVAHAVAAINAGYCEVALITHGEAGRSARDRAGANLSEPAPQYETPYGFIGAPALYSVAARRYMHEYGEDRTRQALAEIAVSTRKWALMNPKAYMKDPMTFEDYHASRWISWPFHLFDCCLVTDAGGGIVVTSAERARDAKKKPVWVLGAAESHSHGMISQMPDLTKTVANVSGPAAMDMAGITHDDIDLAMIYDSFTYTTLVTLESLGFCGPGEGPDFVAGQRTAPGGDFPLNTSGGGLSYTHSGMYGVFLVLEAVRQLRGETGERQLDDPKIALVNGTGGSLSSTGTVVLGVD